jgi:hypothetical protein
MSKPTDVIMTPEKYNSSPPTRNALVLADAPNCFPADAKITGADRVYRLKIDIKFSTYEINCYKKTFAFFPTHCEINAQRSTLEHRRLGLGPRDPRSHVVEGFA